MGRGDEKKPMDTTWPLIGAILMLAAFFAYEVWYGDGVSGSGGLAQPSTLSRSLFLSARESLFHVWPVRAGSFRKLEATNQRSALKRPLLMRTLLFEQPDPQVEHSHREHIHHGDAL